MYDWILKMRRKPIEERRYFVGLVTIFVMGAVTVTWFALFFLGFSKQFASSKDTTQTQSTASVVSGFGGLTGPFDESPQLPSFPDLKALGI